MKKFILLITILFFYTNLFAQGQIINVPTDQPTIQSAINSSTDGDTVLVADGTYFENINFRGKAITVASHCLIDGDETHIDSTIINGSQPNHPDSGSVVYFASGEDTTSVLYGFTITGGTGTIDPYGFGSLGGGGIGISSGAKIQFNKITKNTINDDLAVGGGIVISSTTESTLILNNLITNNTLVSPGGNSQGGGGIFCYDVQSNLVLIAENEISNNEIISLTGNLTGSGGGIYLSDSKAQIRNNIIKHNKAMSGGGISISDYPTSSNHFIINNTILNNKADGVGGGIENNGSIINVINSIFWGNSASMDQQISGSIIVQYSNVEGGYEGDGNISQDPFFADTMHYYLSSNSPCIDNGNPDLIYNDMEDTNNPGNALFPAMGSLRNDMGAYGGNPYSLISVKYGPVFQAFLDDVYSVSEGERQTIVNSFMAEIDQFPFAEDKKHCYFIYSGNELSVGVAGEMNAWYHESSPLQNINGTDFWFRHFVFHNDARLAYKIVINGSTWILDPLNPNTCPGGYGPDSEIAMPDYIQPTEIEYRPNIPHGLTKDTTFVSTVLNNSRTIIVYTPPNYENSMIEEYPIILFHDGQSYITDGSAINILDYLISENLIDPIIAVFVPPVNRDAEYAEAQTEEFSSFIIDELMPIIDAKYKTSKDPKLRAMAGISLGGLITTQICYQHPDAFGLCAPFSPSYSANDKEVFNEVVNGAKKEIKFYVDWGSYEGSIASDSKILVNELENKDYEIKSNEWHEGHNWGSWRAHLDIALEYFFPGSAVSMEDIVDIPSEYQLSQNYPNPFNPSTKIQYTIPNANLGSIVTLTVYDILGRELAKLVNEKQKPGFYQVEWNANNFSSGIYFYQLTAGNFAETKKMILLR